VSTDGEGDQGNGAEEGVEREEKGLYVDRKREIIMKIWDEIKDSKPILIEDAEDVKEEGEEEEL
jgi:hypothetical protein